MATTNTEGTEVTKDEPSLMETSQLELYGAEVQAIPSLCMNCEKEVF